MVEHTTENRSVDSSILSLATITFADITAPIPPGEFLSRYWTREAVLLRAAGRRFDRFCGWDAVNAILNAGDLTFPGIKVSRADRQVPIDLFTTTTAGRPLVDARAVVNCFREGASFGITGADSHWPPLRNVVDCFHDALLESVHTNVYCSPANTQGFQCHYDLHEVFVLQVEGTKHWRVFRPLTEAPVDSWTPEAAEEVLQTEPYGDVVLERGDVLYVPRGHWHYAIAEDSVSLHVTVGITCRKGLAFLDWLSGELATEPVWRRNAPLIGSTHTDGWSADLKASLAEKLSDPTLFDRFQRDSVRDVHPLHTIDLLNQGLPEPTALDRVVFERPPGRPVVVEGTANEVVVTVSGTEIQLEGIKASVLEKIFAAPPSRLPTSGAGIRTSTSARSASC